MHVPQGLPLQPGMRPSPPGPSSPAPRHGRLHPLAGLAAGMAILEAGGNAFDAAVAAGLRAPGRRAAPQRPRRRGPRSSSLDRRRAAASAWSGGRAPRVRPGAPPPPRRSRPSASTGRARHRPPRSDGPRRLRRLADCCCATTAPMPLDAVLALRHRVRPRRSPAPSRVTAHTIASVARAASAPTGPLRPPRSTSRTVRSHRPPAGSSQSAFSPTTFQPSAATQRSGPAREAQIEAARDRAGTAGFVAEADRQVPPRHRRWTTPGAPHPGFLTGRTWPAGRPTYEAAGHPATGTGGRSRKAGPWAQGPALLAGSSTHARRAGGRDRSPPSPTT